MLPSKCHSWSHFKSDVCSVDDSEITTSDHNENLRSPKFFLLKPKKMTSSHHPLVCQSSKYNRNLNFPTNIFLDYTLANLWISKTREHGLKVVRSRENIPMYDHRRSSLPPNDSHPILVSCASAGSLQDVVPVLELPAPPDGGWGWMIVFAGFMCNFMLDGISYSFGVLLQPLSEKFDANMSTIAWVGSLLSGIYQVRLNKFWIM